MTETKPTCGPLYYDGINAHGYGQEGHKAFAAGFVSGQAEKVYLGACAAAMFRPSAENFSWLSELTTQIARRYGLVVMDDPIEHEIWICRHASAILQWSECPRHSAEWHMLRAAACGIPTTEIDLRFHHREGFGKSCDTEEAWRQQKGTPHED